MRQNYTDFNEFKANMISNATTKIVGKNQVSTLSNNQIALLGIYFNEAVSIIYDWRKLSDDSEYLNGSYDVGIVAYIYESYYSYGDELMTSSENGTYSMNAESNLRARYSQRV